MKFGPKKVGELGFAQRVQKLPENEGKILFDEIFSKRVISTEKPLFGPKVR